MGNCMQQISGSVKHHACLGSLNIRQDRGTAYLTAKLQVPSQELYVEWAKNLNKLRANSGCANLLYLPVREEWNSRQPLFARLSLQLFFQPYQHTLFDLLESRRATQIFLNQGFLWHLAYSLAKYLLIFQKETCITKALSFQNILCQAHSSLRIIPQCIVSYLSQHRLVDDLLCDEAIEQAAIGSLIARKQPAQLMQVAGIICLCSAALEDISHFDARHHLSWENMSEIRKKEALKRCEQRYSKELMEIMGDMLNSTKECSPRWLVNKIEAFRPEVQLGLFEAVSAGKAEQEEKQWQQEQKQREKEEREGKNKGKAMNLRLQDSYCRSSTQFSTEENIVIALSERQFREETYLSIL